MLRAPEKALLRGPRVLLRPWRPTDRGPLADLNGDPVAMQHFPAPLTRSESDALADRIEAHFDEFGFGPWALEIPDVAEFAGLVGLMHVGFEAHFTPAVEVAWRLAPALWGKGYVSEAAHCAFDFGFQALHLPQIVAFTIPANLRSLAVMQRLGMRTDVREDFLHPRLPMMHPSRMHRLYRMERQAWLLRASL